MEGDGDCESVEYVDTSPSNADVTNTIKGMEKRDTNKIEYLK